MRLIVLLLCALLAGCASTANGRALMNESASPVVFRVGETVVTVDDLAARLRSDIGPAIADLLTQGQTREQIEQLVIDNNVRGGTLDRMIQDELLMLYARRHGIGVDPAAVDAATLTLLPPAGEPFVDLTDERVAAARSQLVFEVIARNTRVDMYHARHILLADQAAAEAVLADLQAGADFAELARERSQDQASAADGGDLGWQPSGNFVPEFDEAGFNLPLNTPSIVSSQFGVHVIEVLERQAGASRAEKRPFDSFEQLRTSQNAQQFFEESFLPWYDQLRADAQASGELQITPGFDPETVPLPFPEQ